MKVTKTTRAEGKITIFHHQTIRQSHAYQSAEMSYGVEFEVDDNPKSLAKGIEKAEKLVEEALADKFSDQQSLLKSLANQNR